MNHSTMRSASVFDAAGLFTLALRLVAGWTYFSAFWRRLVLENKLDPNEAGYIGEKFNHFLPHALIIKPGIEYLVQHDETLWWFMLAFTIIEAVVGLLFMLGWFTRLMSIGMVLLASGILLGAGWLGTTCLDEWQIGVLGIAAGFTVFLSGGGRVSLDYRLTNKSHHLKNKKWFSWISSGELLVSAKKLQGIAVCGTLVIVFLTLFTNQYFHGGLWGKLHNLSVRPHIRITNAHIKSDTLSLTIFRDEGADVYGSFLVGVTVKDESGNIHLHKAATDLAQMRPVDIHNFYIAKVKPGKHSMVIPLGAKATIRMTDTILHQLKRENKYYIELTDISGIVWKERIKL